MKKKRMDIPEVIWHVITTVFADSIFTSKDLARAIDERFTDYPYHSIISGMSMYFKNHKADLVRKVTYDMEKYPKESISIYVYVLTKNEHYLDKVKSKADLKAEYKLSPPKSISIKTVKESDMDLTILIGFAQTLLTTLKRLKHLEAENRQLKALLDKEHKI